VQQVAAAVYSASVVDNEMDPCFLLIHATNESLRKNAPPLMFFSHQHILPNQHLNKQLTESSNFWNTIDRNSLCPSST
jgi:hypothetical protein